MLVFSFSGLETVTMMHDIPFFRLQNARAQELLQSELSDAVRRGKEDKERLLELLSVKSDELTRLSSKVRAL